MDISFSYYKNIIIIKPIGELDHHNIERHKNEADRQFKKRNSKNIVFDLKDVTFIDSSGIGYIIGRYKLTLFSGGKTAFANVNEQVKKILSISGLNKIIKSYPTTESAILGIEQQGGTL